MDKPIEFKGIKKNNKNFVLHIRKDKNEINIKYSLENPLSKEDVEKINKILDGTQDSNEIVENIKNIVNSYPISIEITTDNIKHSIRQYEKQLKDEKFKLSITYKNKNTEKLTLNIKKGKITIITKSFIFNNERGTILPVVSFGGLRKDFELAAGIMKILENEKIEEIIK